MTFKGKTCTNLNRMVQNQPAFPLKIWATEKNDARTIFAVLRTNNIGLLLPPLPTENSAFLHMKRCD